LLESAVLLAVSIFASTKQRYQLDCISSACLLFIFFLFVSVFFLTQAALLLGQGFLEQDEACPYWPLRSTVEEATVRATPLGDADMFATADSLATLELEFSGIGLCTLWPDKVSIEPGKKSKYYKLNDTLHLRLEAADGQRLYSVSMVDVVADEQSITLLSRHIFTGDILESYVFYMFIDKDQAIMSVFLLFVLIVFVCHCDCF
jgi:succinate dehydrogenase/fumarate reductase cytochrome b subunit